MPKVEVEIMVTKTVEYSVTKEINVPRAVIDGDRLQEWLEENTRHWQGSGENDADVHDETYELNEANFLD